MPTTTLPETFVEYRTVPLDQLHRFPGNANKGDVPQLRGSLQENGQYRALIVRLCDDGRLVVMAGNHTLDALRAEGQTEARCEIHVCDDAAALKINVADNRYAEFAQRDTDLLLEQLSTLDGDYAGTGYTEESVHAMLTPPPPLPDEDEGPGLGEPVIAYNLVFDDEDQQRAWFGYLRWLRKEYPHAVTNGERVAQDIETRGVAA